MSGFIPHLDLTCRAVGLVFLVCAMLFLAGGCGGGGGGGTGVPTSLTLSFSDERRDEGVLTVAVTLDSPAPSGGTAVMISLVLTLGGGNTVELNKNTTIAEGETTGTVNFTVGDPRAVENISVNATSTNPTLRTTFTSDSGGPDRPAPPTRSNPIELEFRPSQLSPPNASDGQDYRDAEFMTHYGLDAISADEAYSRGYFGHGVTIAVADDGMDLTHPDLAVVGKIRDPWHIRNRNSEVRELQKAHVHGTYVALLAAGAMDNSGGTFEITVEDGDPVPTRNVHGVAPQASVIPIMMEGGANPVDAVRYAVDHEAQVLNFSLGLATLYYGKYADRGGVWISRDLPYFRPRLSLDLGQYTSSLTSEFAEVAKVLENRDIVLVWGAGNDGWNSVSGFPVDMCGKNFIDEDGCQLGEISVTQQEFMENFLWLYDQDDLDRTVSFKDMWGTGCGEDNCAEYNSPGGWKEAPSFEPGLLGKWLVVAASDQNGRISEFSNGCGSTRNWCLVAPGEDLTLNPGPMGIDGTSFAAPMVSGALAVLKSRFPDMPMEVIQAILLVSADPVGMRENNREEPDSVYGWGRLNLENAVLQQDLIRLPYSVPETIGAMRGISPGNHRLALVPAFARAGADGQGRSLRRGQCVSPYEVIRRYRNRN